MVTLSNCCFFILTSRPLSSCRDKDAEQQLAATRRQQRQEREERQKALDAAWDD